MTFFIAHPALIDLKIIFTALYFGLWINPKWFF